MSIRTSTAGFEDWLRAQLADRGEIDGAAISRKHALMKAEGGVHAFLRGTFYRWAELWKDVTDGGSAVAAVGDTHVENFGTWRDQEGRLVWGVNDFDEACTLPWTSDLIRLATSAGLSLNTLKHFTLSAAQACDAIAAGYRESVTAGRGSPLVLGEKHGVLWNFALQLILAKPPKQFWEKREEKLTAVENIPRDAKAALQASLPDGATEIALFQPTAGEEPGTGSLGKRRFYALARWKGARILREAKPVVPSAMAWARPGDAGPGLREMLISPRRCPDPFLEIRGKWVVRRLAADSSKIELGDLKKAGSDEDRESKVFESMGAEIGNLHLGSIDPATLLRELDARGPRGVWLHEAAKEWSKRVVDDFAQFGGTSE